MAGKFYNLTPESTDGKAVRVEYNIRPTDK
jgi:hypothetical protein